MPDYVENECPLDSIGMLLSNDIGPRELSDTMYMMISLKIRGIPYYNSYHTRKNKREGDIGES
jgi:hypothetical protein